jgi:Concanavalin A-like lectin/glucanases superfamily
MSRRSVVVLVLSALVAGLFAAAGGMPAAADPPPDMTTPADYAAALAQAQASQAQVEVTSQRSETTQVFANPDATFTTSVASRPVRVRKTDGSWSDLDTTLQHNADGSVGPVAAMGGLRLSGGGTGALAALSTGDRSLEISWPGTLPAPALSGDTARYAEVLPGVDLAVRATPDGFADTVVVKNATAAANPAIKTLHFGLTTTGVTTQVDPDGALSATDSTGQQVFAAPPARMWDSGDGSATVAAAGPDPQANRTGWDAQSSATSPGADARQADAAVQLASGGLSVAPDPALLAQGTYPVYIDPETTFNLTAWSEVNALRPGSVWRTTDNRPAVGHSYDNFGTYTVRSFLGFNTGSIRGAHIYSAFLRTFLVHSWSCSARPVELWALPGGVNQRATWNGQPSWAAAAGAQFQSRLNVAAGYSGCDAKWLSFPATAGVARAAASRAGSLMFGLKAANESDVFAWKKFEVANPRLVPQLDVTYDFAPNPLAAKDMNTVGPGGACVTAATNAPRLSVGTAGITLRARATDPDGSQNKLRVNFEWYRANPQTRIGGTTTNQFNPGTTFTAMMPKQPDGDYAWRAQVQDINPNTGAVMSTTPWSSLCYFSQDATAPSSPTASSPQYPDGQPAPDQPTGVGRAVQFAIDPNGAGDVTKFYWSLNVDRGISGTPITVPAGTGATISITPVDQGVNTLYVMSADSAGNHQRDSVAVPFQVPEVTTMPVAAMDFEDPGADSSGTGRTVTGVDVTTVTGRLNHGNAGHFNGTTSYASTDAAITPYQNFSVSAWVRLTDLTRDSVVASFVGTTASGGTTNPFNLGYDSATHDWLAEFPGVSPLPVALSAAQASTDWTFLAATYDAAAHKLVLYVNGQVSGSTDAAISTAAMPGGPLRVFYGATQGGGGKTFFLTGDIDDVRVWDRLSFGSEVAKVGQWELDNNGVDDSDYGRNLTFGGTPHYAADSANVPASALASTGGSNEWAATAGPVLRTDASYTVAAWVYLAAKAGTPTAVCQLGVRNCPFYLEYRSDLDRWTVDVPSVDSDTATLSRAVSDASPTTNRWVQLVLVHDAAAHTMRLYVGNTASVPVLQQLTTTVPTPWKAAQPFNIGRSKWKGAANGFWNGRIDSVRVWGAALARWEIEDLT